MSLDPIEELLDRLNRGDTAAAEKVLRAYEPFLHMVIRRQLRPALRPKFDSMDVVQSVWADLLEGIRGSGWHFKDPEHLRAFLTRLARNRFVDRCRKYRNALKCERSIPQAKGAVDSVPSQEPRPSEQAQRNELWSQMLRFCPAEHHPLLRMKLQGLPLAEIAERAKLHPSSVRRIFYDLSRRLAEENARQQRRTAVAHSTVTN